MDPLSITAAVVGITASAVQSIRKLRNTIQAINEAPNEIAIVGQELLTIEQAMASIEKISGHQWEALGEHVVVQSKTAISLCKESCTKFQATIEHWTRHGEAGTMSWRDRTTIGLFKQDQIKSTSSQLQSCRNTLTSVVGIANLHNSLQQATANEERLAMVYTKGREILEAVSRTEQQLNDVQNMLKRLRIAGFKLSGNRSDQASAQSQVETERFALEESINLLKALQENITAVEQSLKRGQDQSLGNVRFGDHNSGLQTGISNAPINFTVGK